MYIRWLLVLALSVGALAAPRTRRNLPEVPHRKAAADPDKVARLLAQWEPWVAQTVERSRVPGVAAAIIYQDKVAWQRCYGVRELGKPEPVDPDTVFQLASISKSFTSAMIARLVEEKVVGWDDPVTRYLPDFRLFDPWVTSEITLRDLMCHRSGLTSYAGDELYGLFGLDRAEVFQMMRFQKPVAGFRAAYAYQNVLVAAAGEAAARAVGKPWELLVAEYLFQPLGMRSAVATYNDYLAAPNRVTPHEVIDGRMIPIPSFSDDVCAPAGAVSASLKDVITYLRFQLNRGELDGKRVVSAAALGETQKPHTIHSSSDFGITAYGLGWEVESEGGAMVVHHGGDLGGTASLVMMIPGERLGLVVLTNSGLQGDLLRYALDHTLRDLYLKGGTAVDWYAVMEEFINSPEGREIFDPVEHLPARPAAPVAPGPAAMYTGRYYNQAAGTVRVEAAAGGRLSLTFGERGLTRVLEPWNGHIFCEPDTNTGVIFTPGPDGKAFQVVLKILDLGGRDNAFIRLP